MTSAYLSLVVGFEQCDHVKDIKVKSCPKFPHSTLPDLGVLSCQEIWVADRWIIDTVYIVECRTITEMFQFTPLYPKHAIQRSDLLLGVSLHIERFILSFPCWVHPFPCAASRHASRHRPCVDTASPYFHFSLSWNSEQKRTSKQNGCLCKQCSRLRGVASRYDHCCCSHLFRLPIRRCCLPTSFSCLIYEESAHLNEHAAHLIVRVIIDRGKVPYLYLWCYGLQTVWHSYREVPKTMLARSLSNVLDILCCNVCSSESYT